MTSEGLVKEQVKVPEKVQVTLDSSGMVKVKGPKGEISRKLYNPKIRIAQKGKDFFVSCETMRAKERALVGTYAAHMRNMIQGVTEGFEYKMKIVYAHFPIKASVKGDTFVVENFLGEKCPRKTSILGKTKVTVKGDQVILNGSDIEEVGQTAANIERATKIRGFDPRIFQDGIYITEKPGR